ncbi:MAG: sigma-70 family RNA polymerase sigma factor [Planctomycetota bacterium]
MHEANRAAYELSRDEERRLARAVDRGDRAAIEQFHAALSAPVYRFVFYRLGGRTDDVEEVVQETFLAALEGLSRFRHDASLYTWMCGIAKNLISRQRRQKYRDRLSSAVEEVDDELDSILADLDQELPDEVLEREETQDLVGVTLSSLPVHYQNVLVEKYYAARPVGEIASERGTTPKAIESSLSRARGAFRRAFELIAGQLAKESR